VRITASRLRENVYRILDEVIDTGAPVEIVRKGTVLRIVPEKKASRLSGLRKRRNVFQGDPDSIIGADYLREWRDEWGIR
jgi:prevent-host-death family protein